MRDDQWLNERLENIWRLLFPDIEKANNVSARFKGKWKNKFGHIKLLRNKNSEIAVNSLFKNTVIPEYIIDITLAHELIHYSHGFNSPLKKLFKHPHKGNIVEKELKKRGFENMIKLEKDFVKNKWFQIYKLLIYNL